tara:strand:- start:34 stop:135 length:102 start_codon:yes stop_codon:yes gene_type:complete
MFLEDLGFLEDLEYLSYPVRYLLDPELQCPEDL